MKSLLIGGLLALAAGCSLAAAPVITLSTNNTPSDRRALEDVSREAFRRAGLEVRVIVQPSERSLQSADAGDVDGEGLRIPGLGEQYRNLMPIPEPYHRVAFVAFARRDAGLSVDGGFASLKPHRIAFITGWKMYEANAGDARVVTKVNAPEQLFRMLDAGRVDLALYTRADGNALLRKLALPTVVQLEPSLREVDMFVYLNRKHESLIPGIVRALREMKADGTHRRIVAAAEQG